jgi:hypothetical protein
MNSRFNLGLRPATASSNSVFNRTADALDGNASAFPDDFTLETLLVPAEASHSSVFALSSRQEQNFRLFVFNQLQTSLHSFSLFAKELNAISILFNHFHTLCKSARG